MIFTPFDYQKPMIDWCLERDRSALFCSPGLGKTVVTLKVIDEKILSGAVRGVFLVAPLRVKSITWKNQIELWNHSKWLRYYDLCTEEGQRAWDRGEEGCIWLTHFDMLASKEITRNGKTTRYPGHAERFLARKHIPANMLVIDELSIFKDPSGRRAKHLHKYAKHFTQRIGLTGTPIANSYLDLWNQAKMLDDGERLGKSFFQYRLNYFTSDYMGYKWDLRPGAKEKIDAKIADLALVMLGDDYLDVPTTETIDIEVSLSGKARAAYTKLEKELLLELERGDVVALNAAVLAGKLLQITAGTVYGEEREVHEIHDQKIQAFLKLRRDTKDSLLVLTAYQHETDRLLKAVPSAVKFHESLMDDWQAGKIKTMIANPGQLSHGIDGLQRGGRAVVWMTPTYSNEKYLQTNARLIRTGQSQETKVYRIIAKDTIDEAVIEALRTKGDQQTGLMNALKNLQRLKQTP